MTRNFRVAVVLRAGHAPPLQMGGDVGVAAPPKKRQNKKGPCGPQNVEKVDFLSIFIGGHVPTMKIPLELKIAFESPSGMRTQFFAMG